MRFALRLTDAQHTTLRNHLFPGDGCEAVALLLCGRANGTDRHVFTVRKVVPVPLDAGRREPHSITWPTSFIDDLVHDAYGRGQAIVKVHSHPTGYAQFSPTDDRSDQALFASVTSLLDDGLPHASMVMLPDGALFGRVLGDEGRVIAPLARIACVGNDLRIWTADQPGVREAYLLRQAQAFGEGTTRTLRTLAAAVIGCSGTGSIVAELLARLGIGRLVLVDPDVVEEKNLNRILNSGKEDAYLARPKVQVVASAVARTGLGQEVTPLALNVMSKAAVTAVAQCDVVFGCMDGAEGRHLLNRLATFYNLPYFDVGVRLDADGNGGIAAIAGAVHYLQPGRSSLLSRNVYSMPRVEAEELRRTNPQMYREQVKQGYLRGVDEDRPAVISVNMLLASLLVNEFLARLRPYRNLPNDQFAQVGVSLSEMQFYPEPDGEPCGVLLAHVGRGDVSPLLDRPALS